MSSTLAGFSPDRVAAHRAARHAPVPTPSTPTALLLERLLEAARLRADAPARDPGTLDRAALLRLRAAIDAMLGQADARPGA